MSIFDKPMYVESPIRSMHKNMVLTKKGTIWAYYRIKADEINPNNNDKLDQSKDKWMNLFRKVLPKYEDFEFFLYPKDKQLVQRFMEFSGDWAKDDSEMALSYAQRTIKKLEKRLGRVSEDDFVLGVQIKDLYENQNVFETGRRVVADVSDRLIRLFTGAEVDDQKLFKSVSQIENNLYQVIAGRKGVRVTEAENVYLNRFNYIRGMEHDREFEMTRSSRITDSILDSASNAGYLHLKADCGNSVISILPISQFEHLNISYNHLFLLARKQAFDCEFRIKAHYAPREGYNGVVSRAGRLRSKQTAEVKEILANDAQVTSSIQIQRGMVTELINEIDMNEPLIQWLGCFVVYGKDLEECKRNSDQLMDMLMNLQIEVVRPVAKQLYLFYLLLQGKSIEGTKDWLQLTNSQGLAETCFAVSNNVGTNTGWYVGMVDSWLRTETLKQSISLSRSIVLYSMFLANQGQEGAVTDSPHIAITGETGKGKSYLAGMLFFQACLMDADILMIDPKKEKRGQFRSVLENKQLCLKYPLFANLLRRINFITLDARDKKNHGVLDPIVFLSGVDAKDTALGMIESIYVLEGKDLVETAINRYLDDVIARRELGERVGLLTVIDLLEKDSEKVVRQAGNLLRAKVKNSILELGFSSGSTNGLDLTQRISVIEIEGLDLPDSDQVIADYTDMNKKSICLMMPLGKFCEKFGSNPNRYTIEFFDEAWTLEKAKRGKQILKSMRRVGRSMSNILVYITQSVKDTKDDSETGNFGVVFAFDDKDERVDILNHVGIEVSDRNVDLLKHMKKGQCLMRDLYGRVAKIAVDNLFEEWHLALQTVKQTASTEAERKFA